MTSDARHVEWMRQWRTAAAALADERARRLARLTDEEARAAVHALLDMARALPLPQERVRWSGLVEQQAILHRRR